MQEMEAIETMQYNNHTINIFQDEDAESPREWDNLGTMYCSHKNYKLGDVQGENGNVGFLDYINDEYRAVEYNDQTGEEEIQKRIKENLYILPLYLYDHSGITMSTTPFSCRRDSGQVGRIYVEKKKAIAENHNNEEKALEVLRGEVEIYDKYLTGEVCGYVIEGEKSNDSCRGFYSTQEAIEEAKRNIE